MRNLKFYFPEISETEFIIQFIFDFTPYEDRCPGDEGDGGDRRGAEEPLPAPLARSEAAGGRAGSRSRRTQSISRGISLGRKQQKPAAGARLLSMHSAAGRDLILHNITSKIGKFCKKFAKFCKFLAGSFSAVSKRNFARKYAFDSIFQALQDLHTFAPLRSQHFRVF